MNSYIATREFAPGTSRGKRSRRTLALQIAREDEKRMAMEAEKQRAVGRRLRELRGARTQQPIADFVGVTLRAYQAWEAGDSGLKWANIEKLAEYHGVSEDYLLYGTEEPSPTTETTLESIDRKLAEVAEDLSALRGALLGDEDDAQAVAGVAVRLLQAAGLLQLPTGGPQGKRPAAGRPPRA